MSIGSAWAEDEVIFSWEGGEEATVTGGTVTANNAGTDCTAEDVNVSNAIYKVIRLRGAKDYSTYVVVFTLDKALLAGDQLKVTGYRNKNAANKQTGFLAKFDKGGSVTTGGDTEFVNIDTSDASADDNNRGTEPNTITLTVPDAAAGSKTITATRANTGTNFFITKIEIVRPVSDKVTPMGKFVSEVLNLAPGASVETNTLSILDIDDNDISDKYSVTYSSNNTNVATVDAETGVVTLVGTNQGTAKITATLTPSVEGYAEGKVSYTVNVAAELTYPYSWDFTTFETSGTWDLLAADETNWEANGSSTYQSKVTMSGIIAANGVTIPETNFIKFGSFGAKKIYLNKGSLQLNGKSLTISVPDLKAGYYIVVDFENPSGSESRGLTVGNINEASENKLDKSTRETRIFTVKEDGDVTLQSTSGVRIYKIKVSEEAPAVPITITGDGWATLYTDDALDFSGTGLEAFTATCAGTTVTLNPVSNVAAGTGVVLKGTAGEYSIPVIASSETDKGDLQGAATATAYNKFDGHTLYVLTKNGDNAQFAPVDKGEIAAGKAFLKVAAGGSSRLNVVIAGETTGIKAIEAQEAQEGIINLQGQRVAKAQKGLYIVNGKKAIVK